MIQLDKAPYNVYVHFALDLLFYNVLLCCINLVMVTDMQDMLKVCTFVLLALYTP